MSDIRRPSRPLHVQKSDRAPSMREGENSEKLLTLCLFCSASVFVSKEGNKSAHQNHKLTLLRC